MQAIRRADPVAELVLVAGEPGASNGVAVDRPPLSKVVLADQPGGAPPEPLSDATQLAELNIQLVSGTATDLDTGARRVRLHGGEELDYDHVVIATGATPRALPGIDPIPGVHVLRTAADALALRADAVEGARVVIVGGGFIGAEVAWTLHRLGRLVTVVEPLQSLMMRGLGFELGAALTRRHAAAGIDVRLGVGVAGLDGGQRVTAVQLTDGSSLPADVVLLGLGVAPETAWLADTGLELADGVLCDENLAARGAEGVWAVGDVARWYHPRYGEEVRVEHWTNAVEGAAVVAGGITGHPRPHDSVPSVWTDQLGVRLQVFGRIHPEDEVAVVHGDFDDAFVALVGGAGRLQAVAGIGAVKHLLPYRKLLLAGASWADALAA